MSFIKKKPFLELLETPEEVSSESKKSYLASIHELQDGIQMSKRYILGRRRQCF